MRRYVASVAISRDGGLLTVASYGGGCCRWRLRLPDTAEMLGQLGESESGCSGAGGDRDATSRYVLACAVSPCGELVATGGDGSGQVRLYAANGVGAELAVLAGGHTDEVNALAFSPDGTFLASASEDGGVTVWAVKTCAIAAQFEPSADGAGVHAVRFSQDGRLLVCSSGSGAFVYANPVLAPRKRAKEPSTPPTLSSAGGRGTFVGGGSGVPRALFGAAGSDGPATPGRGEETPKGNAKDAGVAVSALQITTKTVTLVREKDRGFGLEVMDAGSTLIHNVLAGSVSAKAGCRPGEVVVAVNGQSLVGATHAKVLRALRQSSSLASSAYAFTLTLTTAVVVEPASSVMPAAELSVTTLLAFQDHSTCLIVRQPGQGLGLELANHDAKGGGTVIKRVVAGGVAAAAGCTAGGRIMARKSIYCWSFHRESARGH